MSKNKEKTVYHLKMAGLAVLIMLLSVSMTACDMFGDSDLDQYSLEVEVDFGELALGQEDLEEAADNLEVSVISGETAGITYEFERDGNKITGLIEGVAGSATLEVSHEFYGEAHKRVGPEDEDSIVEFELGGDASIELGVDSELLNVMELDTAIHKIEALNSDGLDWIGDVAFMDGDEATVIRQIDESFYVAGEEGRTAEVEMAFLNSESRIIARAETVVETNEDKTVEIEFVDDGDVVAASRETEVLDSNDYLASYTIDEDEDMDEPEQEIVSLIFEGEHSAVDIPEAYIAINETVMDLDYLTADDNNDDDNFEHFREVFQSEAEEYDYDFDAMNLYIKTFNADGLQTADLTEEIDEGEVKITFEELIEDEDDRKKLAMADITYQREVLFPADDDVEEDNEIVYYDVSVSEVYGVEGARSFTIGDPGNTPHGFGGEMTRDVAYE